MRIIKYFIFLILLSGVSLDIYAQNRLTGKITDKKTGEPLSYANIYLPDQNKGTQSGESGKYELKNLPKGDLKIQISYVGYKTHVETVEISEAKNTMDFSLTPVAMQAEEVVISGGSHSTQHENPIKIERIEPEQIANSGNASFAENLTFVPGVDIIAKGPAVTKPVIRGLTGTNILVLNNGVKLENFQFSENHPFLIDDFGADRIEVIKGAASLLYGSDAVGGVINLIPEKPAPVGTIRGDFSGKYFSNTNGFQSDFGIKGSEESIYWGLRAGIKSHEDYISGDGKQVPNTRFNEQSLKAMTGYHNSFGNMNLYYSYNRPTFGMSVGKAVPLIAENGRENDIWYQDLTNHLLSTKNRFYAGGWKFDLNAAYQMNNRKLQTDTSMPFKEMVDMDMSSLSWDLKAHLPFGDEADYIIGVQGADKTNRNNEAPNHVIPDADVFDVSALGFARIPFGEKLKTQFGLRYDYRDLKTADEPGKLPIDTLYGKISASAGATYRINEAWLLRANIATAYRTPNLAELTQNGVHGVRYEQGNPELESQRSYEADLSTHYHNNWLMLDIAGFYNRISNYIYIAPTDDSINNYRVYRYTQNSADIYGTEISMNVLPVDWFDIRASYSWIEAVREDGENLPLIPHDKLKADFSYQPQDVWKFNTLCFNLGGTYAFEQKDIAPSESISDSYFLLHAGISGSVMAGRYPVRLSVRINNLLDEKYTDHLSTLKDMGFYNMGRNIVVSLKVPFGVK